MKVAATVRPLPSNCPPKTLFKNINNSELLLETKLPRQKISKQQEFHFILPMCKYSDPSKNATQRKSYNIMFSRIHRLGQAKYLNGGKGHHILNHLLFSLNAHQMLLMFAGKKYSISKGHNILDYSLMYPIQQIAMQFLQYNATLLVNRDVHPTGKMRKSEHTLCRSSHIKYTPLSNLKL